MPTKINELQIINAIPEAALIIDRDGKLLYLNQQAEKELDLEIRNLIGVSVSSIFPQVSTLVEKCLQTDQPQLGMHVKDFDLEMLVNITPIKSNDRKKSALFCFKKLKSHSLPDKDGPTYEVLAKWVETIFNYSTDGLWLYDRNGIVIKTNNAAKTFLEKPVESLAGKHYQDLIQMGLLDRSVVPEVLQAQKQITLT